MGRAVSAGAGERGNVAEACPAVGRARATVCEHWKHRPEFAAAWEEAQETAWDRMEAELYRCAVEGVDEPVFFGGECIGHRRVYSDSLLLAGVKAHRPEYRDKSAVEISGPAGAPIRTQAEVTAQLEPYESAVAMLVDSLIALRQLEAAPLLVLAAPTGLEIIDFQAEPQPSKTEPPSGRPCPRGDKPGRIPTAPFVMGLESLPPRKVDVNHCGKRGAERRERGLLFRPAKTLVLDRGTPTSPADPSRAGTMNADDVAASAPPD